MGHEDRVDDILDHVRELKKKLKDDTLNDALMRTYAYLVMEQIEHLCERHDAEWEAELEALEQ